MAKQDKNMEVYNKVKTVPKTACKQITGGRLNGMTDIKPMWRIEKLTEVFGICGFGWRYEIVKQWIEGGSNGESAAFTNINLYVKYNGEWSEAISGTGGNKFVSKERDTLYTNDECFKMALTDAISVACKSLGFGADVYMGGTDRSKYDSSQPQPVPNQSPKHTKALIGNSSATSSMDDSDKRIMPRDKYKDIATMLWIEKYENLSIQNGSTFILLDFLKNNLGNNESDLKIIVSNYSEYKSKIKNNGNKNTNPANLQQGSNNQNRPATVS